MSEPLDLEAIEARANAATEGPWHWAGNTDVNRIYLATWVPGMGRCTVMDFSRWGMQSARPRFSEDLMMVNADKRAVYEVAPEAKSRDDQRVYRADIVGIDHPDAEFIAHARQDVPAMLERIREQEAELARLRAVTSPTREELVEGLKVAMLGRPAGPWLPVPEIGDKP